jgi:signal transduction histidine kinase
MRALEIAAGANDAKSALLAAMSHEQRTPLMLSLASPDFF